MTHTLYRQACQYAGVIALSGTLFAADVRGEQPHLDKPDVKAIDDILKDYAWDNKGDPKTGTILFLRDTHRSEGMSKEDLKTIGRYQLEVLKELYRIKPATLFMEDWFYDEQKEIFDTDPTLIKIRKDIMTHFKEGVVNDPTDKQLARAGWYGAGWLYAIFNPVKLGNTANRKEFDAFQEKFKQSLAQKGGLEYNVMFDERERCCWAHLREYFAKNPGSTVVLQFGALHEFAKYASKEFNPVIRSREWPVDPLFLLKITKKTRILEKDK